MFTPDALNSSYYEEQAAKYAAKRLAQEQQRTMKAATASSASSTPNSTRSATPANATAQPKQMGVLGTFIQGFVRGPPVDPYYEAAMRSTASTPGSTPGQEKSELEALIAEKKRDADICSLMTW